MTAPAVAIIPARKGSRGVPGKNLVTIGSRSLVARAIDACRRAGNVDDVVVTTDDDAIAAEAERHGARVVRRPAELATDEASSESALLHALDQLEITENLRPCVVAFVQCTSPFIDPTALGSAIDRVKAGEVDVAFSAVPTYEFLWSVESGLALAKGLNHDATVRLRRQDRQPDWRETGAFYVMDADGFRAAQHRFFGRVTVAPVAEADALEIDTPAHVEIARALARARGDDQSPMLPGVVAVITDFDGVHTDDRASVRQDGAESVVVSRADGHGVRLLREAGIPMLILSTETNPLVARRAAKLGVDCLHGLDDKLPELQRWLADHALDPARAAYVGNDVNDLPCMEAVGYPIAVADAHPRVIDRAVYVTHRGGGRGAVREVADLILASRA